MLFHSSPAPSRASRRRTRALRSLQVVVVLAFALFVSVANATAQDDAVDPNAPVDQAPQVEPVDETAEIVEEAPVVEEPAPVVEETPVVEEPAPVVEEQPIVEEQSTKDITPTTKFSADQGTNNRAQNPRNEFRDVTSIQYCHASSSGGWTLNTATNPSFLSGHDDHDDDVIPSFVYYNSSGNLRTYSGNEWPTWTRTINGVARSGSAADLIAAGCVYTPPVDRCTNVSGQQDSVPTGLVRVGTRCLGTARGCYVTESFGVVTALAYFEGTQDDFSTNSNDVIDWTTSKRVSGGSVVNANDSNLGATYLRSIGFLQFESRTGAQLLANGCSFTTPPPADVCANIAGNQASLPQGRVQVGPNCVPPAVSCVTLDQDPADDGSTTDSVAGDGVTDACTPRPAACDDLDQIGEDTNGNAIIDTCIADPASCDPLDQTDSDTNGNGIVDTCVPNPASCDDGEGERDSNENGIIDTCDPIECDAGESPVDTGDNDVADTCQPVECDTLDEYGIDTGTNGVNDSCAFQPAPACATGVLVDRNGNGNMDLCAVVVPSLSCKVTDDNGVTTLYWVYTSNSSVGFTEPGSVLIGGGLGESAPTSFTAAGDWTSTLASQTGSSAWLVHGQVALGSHSSTPCFEDQCPNIEPGDQREVPAGMVHNNAGNCVPAPPTCQFDERGVDNGRPLGSGRVADDGVIDRCRPKPDVQCAFDETAVDTNENGSLDTCRPNPDVTDCAFDERATDTNGNGSKDTCVPKPAKWCGLEAGVDTTDNGTIDTCVSITPIIDCGVYNANGSRTLHWRWRNSSGHAVTIPIGLQNAFFSWSQPTYFPPGEGSFTTTIPAGLLNAQMWMVTGQSAVGTWASGSGRVLTRPCFEDACPNLAGDQDGVPSGMAVNDRGRCVAETTSCEDFDMAPGDTDSDGVADDCVPVEHEGCATGVAVDTNDNGNADSCVSVTPVLECVTNQADGSFLAWFSATNDSKWGIEVPLGERNQFADELFSGQPTGFPTGSIERFSVVVPEGATASWTLTGSTATAAADSTACFEDTCTNLAGDQQELPSGMVHNTVGDCVGEPPSCDTGLITQTPIESTLRTAVLTTAPGEQLVDSDSDGVADTCVGVTCDADMTPVDSGDNGVADRCVAKTIECPTTAEAKDLIPAGAPNGVLDTCVAKEQPGGSAVPTDSTPGSGSTGGTDQGSTGGGDSAPGDSEVDAGAEEDGSEAPADTDADAESDGNTLVAGEADGSGDDLPFTGAALGLLGMIGLGALGAGIVVRRQGRREDPISE